MKVLLLGSEGTLGKSLYKFLYNRKIETDHHIEGSFHNVGDNLVTDLNSVNVNSKYINVIPWDIKLGEKYDLRNENCIDEILKEVDFVIFLAFDVGGSKYNVKNKEFIDNNMKIIVNTFNSLYKSKKPFIYTTSCMSNMLTNSYGSLKNISEHYVNLLGGINVKLWNVYGNEEINDKSHVIPDFIDSALKNKNIQMKTMGNDERQFIYCDDFSEAIFTILCNYDKFIRWLNDNSKTCIDISSNEWITIYDTALLIKNVLKNEYNNDINIIKGDGSDNHTNKTNPSYSLLNDLWKPKTSLYNGIKNIIEETKYS